MSSLILLKGIITSREHFFNILSILCLISLVTDFVPQQFLQTIFFPLRIKFLAFYKE